ncbi:hypothetical protein L593_02595 [Salinarchaeum sp. Harcht-Bsk1]|uniref:hypothetical protein n=1 Tax=Salinarchaeum sp. Harcht-Bsk1 TaxID=1333523 RepID=UPI0003423342|nr:hypothetical protein [Salinarchaeum sp. Harcht-Bsk1]AGN00470.1 hypothetical protein L593_02595 [Salinarchaeum sp. Harcht-Bsk1]
MRRQLTIAGAALGVAAVTILLLAALAPPAPAPSEPLNEEVRERRVSFDGYESGVWPYLSSERGFRRTSPVNVVVRGEPSTVLEILKSGDATDFEDLPPEEEAEGPGPPGSRTDGPLNGTAGENLAIDWESTEGATRYAYVDDGSADGGRWIDESAQLQDGTYYGHRHHIRLYESPREDEPWVAMQAHSEHFDWFTLRHEVHGSDSTQDRVESAFFGDPRVDELWRSYVANDDSSDSDGWASMVVLLVGFSLIGGLTIDVDRHMQRTLTPVDRRRLHAVRERLSMRLGLLVVTNVAIVLGVRFGGIALERHAAFLTMHQIAALLYPILTLGLPLASYSLATGIERRMDAALGASSGLAIGVVADYMYLRVEMIAIPTLFQRLAVILALGLIAAGAASRATREHRINGLVTTGVILWVALLAATVLQII